MVSTFLYVPNLIGYSRVVLQLACFACALSRNRLAVVFYITAQFLDAVDGFAARMLNQTSQFGRVLDMVTDRASTTCLCMVLCHLYPGYIGGFTTLATLDLFSHWYHMHATLLLGGSSHKDSDNWVVRLYYYRPVLFCVCAGTEFWYISLYALQFGELAMWWQLVAWGTTPIMLFKQLTNVVQLFVAMRALVERDDAAAAAEAAKKQ